MVEQTGETLGTFRGQVAELQQFVLTREEQSILEQKASAGGESAMDR